MVWRALEEPERRTIIFYLLFLLGGDGGGQDFVKEVTCSLHLEAGTKFHQAW